MAHPDFTAGLASASATSAACAASALAGSAAGLVDGAELYGPICFQTGRFRRIAFLPEVTAHSGRALARGTDEQPWYPVGSELAGTNFLLGNPGLNDAVLQVLQACVPHRRVRPTGCRVSPVLRPGQRRCGRDQGHRNRAGTARRECPGPRFVVNAGRRAGASGCAGRGAVRRRGRER